MATKTETGTIEAAIERLTAEIKQGIGVLDGIDKVIENLKDEKVEKIEQISEKRSKLQALKVALEILNEQS